MDFCAVLLIAILAEASSHTIITNSSSASLHIQPGSPCKSDLSCIDCFALQICAIGTNSRLRPIANISCPDHNPYCDSSVGSCVSYTPEGCGERIEEHCFSDGVYPSLNDCRKYFKCTNGEAFMYSCGSGLKFDIVSKKCESESMGRCASVDCSEMDGRRVPLYGKNYFAYCLNGHVKMIGICPPGHIFDVQSQQCKTNECNCPISEETHNSVTKNSHHITYVFLIVIVGLVIT